MFKHVTVRQISIIIGWTFFVGAMEERAPVVLKIDEVQQNLRGLVGADVVDDVQSTTDLVQSIAERNIVASLRKYTPEIDSVLSGMVGSPWQTRPAIAVTGNGYGVLSILPLEGGACPCIGPFNGSYELPAYPVPAPGAMRHLRTSRVPRFTYDDVKKALQKKLEHVKYRKGSERYPTEITDAHVNAVRRYLEGDPYKGLFDKKTINGMLHDILDTLLGLKESGKGQGRKKLWTMHRFIEWQCPNGQVYRIDRSCNEDAPWVELVTEMPS